MSTFARRIVVLLCLGLLLLPLALPSSSEAAFSITIYFGRPHCASGFGICRIDIGAGAREGAERAARKGQASGAVEQDKTARGAAGQLSLKIDMRSALPERASVLPVGENLALDAATSKALGHKSITVLKGDYKIDYSGNKLGSFNLKIEARD